ncbi:hypothetical protein Fmac_024006 [Flemingia macrophylla]|uniref:Transposase (putative) gypsy type domain-containing protein n=1 Tax=Flemingia macrophylla TaxID=520843 RepID=A0ABD1LNN3_9FABA
MPKAHTVWTAVRTCQSLISRGLDDLRGGRTEGVGSDDPRLDADVAAEHKRLAWKREFEPVLLPGYEWVNGEVGANYSRFRDEDSILNLMSYTKLLDGFPFEEKYPIGLSRCQGDESPYPNFVFLDKSKFAVPSFYVYDCWFRDLHVKLPFDDFIMSVLRMLNMAPTQLHPNSWAAMQAFKVLCLDLGVTPSAPLFLYFYSCKPGYDAEEGYSSRQGDNEAKAKWISLSRIPKRYLLESFTTWTKKPRRCDGCHVKDLPEADREGLRVLSLAPRPIPPRMLILLPKSSQIAIDFIGIMTKVGDSEFDVKKLMAGRARPKSIAKANQRSDPSKLRGRPRWTRSLRLPRGRGRTRGPRRDHAYPPSDGIPEVLAGPGFINSKVCVQDFISLDFMSAEGRRAVEGLSSTEKLKALGEMYFRCVALSQVLALEPSPELSTLQAKLGEAERVTGEILARNSELVEENKKALADNVALRRQVEELTAANSKLAEGREKAIMELRKLDKELKDFKTWALAEAASHHEHGFNHAIRQAKHFCDLRGHEFDIGMDFYKGEYMSYDDMPENADPDEDVVPLVADLAPQGGDAAAEGDTQADDTHAEEEQYIDIDSEEEVAPAEGAA